jgi:hypothetical protein
MAAPLLDSPAARLALRALARTILQNPGAAQPLQARLAATLALAETEPVQGALADIFVSFDQRGAAIKQQALQVALPRLPRHVARWFAAQANAPALPLRSPLATRWSVVARASAGIATRARRCSADDSRQLARQAVQAMAAGDTAAQQAFLHHCIICHDNLAFMLARQALLKTLHQLPPSWEEVSVQLQDLAAGAP